MATVRDEDDNEVEVYESAPEPGAVQAADHLQDDPEPKDEEL